MKIVLAAAAVVLLAGCSSPYKTALENRITPRPEAPVTKADTAALTPYDTASYFKGK